MNSKNEPDYINPEGVKWWPAHSITAYARSGKAPLAAECFLVERPDGYKTFLLVMGGEIAYEAQQAENIGYYIDREKLLRNVPHEEY